MIVFSGVTPHESKERFYAYLYLTGITPDHLRQILRNENEYGFAVGMFGFERTIQGLSVNPKPISATELEDELWQYGQYCESFDRQRAEKIDLAYLSVPVNNNRSLENLDHWYERDAAERVGNFNLYHVRLRGSSTTMNAVSH